VKINVIPNVAEAQVDIRRLPNETSDEIVARIQRIINDTAVDVVQRQARPCPRPNRVR